MELIITTVTSLLFGFLGGFLYQKFSDYQEEVMWKKFLKDFENTVEEVELQKKPPSDPVVPDNRPM